MGDGTGEPMSELQDLQFKANQATDETLESTRRMMQLCEEVFINAFFAWFSK